MTDYDKNAKNEYDAIVAEEIANGGTWSNDAKRNLEDCNVTRRHRVEMLPFITFYRARYKALDNLIERHDMTLFDQMHIIAILTHLRNESIAIGSDQTDK